MPVYARPDSDLRSLGLWRFSKTAQQRTVSQGSGELVIKCYTGNISRITLLRGLPLDHWCSLNPRRFMSDQLLYRHFLDHFADAFFLHDDCGQLLDINMQACESLGYSREEMLNLKVLNFSHDHDERALIALWNSMEPGFNTVLENQHQRKNGTIYPVEVKIACQLVEGRKLFYAMARDISERVRREEEIRQLNIELEQRWKDSSRLLNSVMRDTPDIVFVKDLDGRYLFSNPAADKVAGFAEGTLIGKTDQDIWGGNNNFATDDSRAIHSEKPIISEGYVKMDGRKCLFQSIKSPYHDENGNVIGLLGIARDITSLRATEKELRTSNHFLRRAERLSRIGSWRLDLKTGEFWASEMMYEINGADPKGPQLTPDDLRRLMPPEDHARVAAAINLCAQTGQSYALDVTHTTPDRGSFPASILGQADRDAQGNIIGISGVVQDLSEREAAKQRLEAVADNLPSGAIFRLENNEGAQRLSYISAGVEKLMGIKATAIIANQQVYLDRIHPSDIALYKLLMEEAKQQNKLFDHSFRIIRPNGIMRWLRCRSAPRHTETGTVWDGILLDISREREAELALQQAKEAAETAERTKSEFLATMSHEIRTPMNTVIGMTRLMQQTPLSPKQRNYLEKVELSANALLSIINDILDYSKIEAGMLELESVEFALDDILETVSAVTTLKAEEKGLEIVYSVSPEVPRHLCGDPLRLSQVLNNLVSNAIKFTHQGEVVVSIEKERPAIARASTGVDEVQTLLITVRDTGIGMNQAQIQQLFRPFSQADSQTTRRYGGTGLGLAICNRLVQLMGGRFDVFSAPGRGSTFRFAVQMMATSQPTKRPQIYRVGAANRVLIVDDNASARDILSTMVRGFGMRTDAVDSGDKALAALHLASHSGSPYDLVLMDWRMPGMDGLEAARRIREVEHLATIPAVLMVTAYGRDEVQRQAEQLGLQGLLTKPVTESVLFNSILEILQAHSPGYQAAAAPSMADISPSKRYPELKGKRVLVVDDNALNREVAADFLDLVGIQVELATDGEQALKVLERQSFDLVLMDVHMPNMDGMQATRAIRQQPALHNLPVIALTAQARTEDREAIEAAGMNAHLSKPIDDKLLYETLCQWMAPDASSAQPQQASTPAFDLSQMQQRFRGNTNLISRVLNGFARDFVEAPSHLQEYLSQSRWQDLAMLAHTLKGSLGYLGAPALMEQASQIESACRTPQGIMSLSPQSHQHLQQQVPVFAEQLAQLLKQLPEAGAETTSPAPAVPASSLAEVDVIIEELRQLITDGNYAAVEGFERLQHQLDHRRHGAQLQRIRKNIEDLEADAALQDLDLLKQQLHQTAI